MGPPTVQLLFCLRGSAPTIQPPRSQAEVMAFHLLIDHLPVSQEQLSVLVHSTDLWVVVFLYPSPFIFSFQIFLQAWGGVPQVWKKKSTFCEYDPDEQI